MTELTRFTNIPFRREGGHCLRRSNVFAIRPLRRWSGRVRSSRRTGLSLLEVVLSLAILAMSVALLSQITKQATDNGMMAQRLATAQMLCESKMSEVLVGAIPVEGNTWTEITDAGVRGTWYYQIQTVTAERKDMVGVRLSVSDQPNSTTENPELFFIVRWMIDPNLGLDSAPQSSGPGTESGGTTGGAASGSAGGSASGGSR